MIANNPNTNPVVESNLLIRNNRGNIYLGLLAVILIAIFESVYFFETIASSHRSNQNRYLVLGSVKELLHTAGQTLDSPHALMNTVRGSLNKSGADLERCMNDSNYDCPVSGGPLSIYLDDPNLVFSDSLDPDSGLNFALEKCNGYSNAADSTCVLKLNLTWTPVCPAASPCYLPAIDVQGTVELKLSFLDRLTLNTSSFTFSKRIR